MANEFKSKVEITAQDGVSKVMESIANKAGNMARVVHDRTKFLMNDMAGSIGKKMEAIANNSKGLWGQSGVIGAIGGALVASGAIETMSSLAEKAEQLHRTAIGLGLSTQDMQRWSFAAKQAGVDADMMTRGVANMNKAVFEVAHGGAKAQGELFKQMGVSVRDAKGNARGITDVAMDVAQRFKEHVDRIAKLQAGGQGALANTLQAESDNAAENLFGMKAREVAAMMAHGKQGIQQAFASADKTGGVLSDEQIEKLERYQAATAKLDFAKQGLMVRLFADKMEWAANKASGLADKIGAFEQVHPVLFKMASTALVSAGGLIALATSARLAHMGFTWLAGGELIGQIQNVGMKAALSGKLMDMLSGGIKGVSSAMRLLTAASPWLLAIGAGAALIYYNWDKIQPVIQRVSDALSSVWETVQPVVSAFGSAVWSTFSDAVSDVWGSLQELANAFSGLLPSFSGASSGAGDIGMKFQFAAGVAEFFRETLDLVKIGIEILLAPLRVVETILESVGDKIKSVSQAFSGGGAFAAVVKLFDVGENAQILAARAQKNFSPSLHRAATAAKDLYDAQGHPITAEEMQKREQATAGANRQPAKTMSEQLTRVKLDGTVPVEMKGKLGIDMRVQADAGLKVSQTGVDASGASYVGDVGMSNVTP